MREIPFALIQYPLFEYFKSKGAGNNLGIVMLAGGLAGGTSAFLTTPIDVIKTRVMTSQERDVNIVRTVIYRLWEEKGVKGFFAGFHVRTLYITVGGVMFFGTNESAKKILGFN